MTDRAPLLAHAAADLGAALRSGPYRAFVLLWLAAAGLIFARRGVEPMLGALAVIAVALVVFGALAWFGKRLPGVHAKPDPVRAPRAEALAVGVVALGLGIAAFASSPLGVLVAGGGLAGWLVAVLAARPRLGDLRWVVRSWLPYAPLLLAIVAPKLPSLGAEIVPRTLATLPSGMIQQLLLQVGLTARAEALLGRRDLAAVVAALVFAVLHVPLNLSQAGGDWVVAAANAIVLQGGIGLVACAAFLRHRAPLALGFAHALMMA